jgi:HSP20 family protein
MVVFGRFWWVIEKENSFEVHADLPGVDMKDVDIQLANGMLHIAAKREHVHEEKTQYTHHIERSFGQVKRSVAVPKNALLESADARFENGVLTVEFAKRPAIKDEGPRKLAIRTAEPTKDVTN